MAKTKKILKKKNYIIDENGYLRCTQKCDFQSTKSAPNTDRKSKEFKLWKKQAKKDLKKHIKNGHTSIKEKANKEKTISEPVVQIESKPTPVESEKQKIIPEEKKPEPVQQKVQKQKNDKHKQRFQRVNPEAVEFIDDRLKDNSFNLSNQYGYKAYQDLSVTKGKGFTKEKNKKKKGSYRGGQIDVGTHSFKFSSDSE